MIVLRLFQKIDPALEVDSRILTEGEIVIGRDAEADWAIADPTKTLSRRHCVVALRGGVVTIRDDSVNGVFRVDGPRLAAGEATPVEIGETLALGAFLLRVEAQRTQGTATTARPVSLAPTGEASSTGALLDAFCQAAQIDSSVLSGEDPKEVMRRLGGVYRQMVAGLSQLMDERTRAKARYGLEWTSVQALDNNPFRWAPPQQVAIELLQTRQDGFLTGEPAVKASYADLLDHQNRMLAGTRAAIEAVLVELAPDTIAQGVEGQSFLIKRKTDVLWANYTEAHDQMREDLRGWAGGSGSQAFRDAYQGEDDDQDAPI